MSLEAAVFGCILCFLGVALGAFALKLQSADSTIFMSLAEIKRVALDPVANIANVDQPKIAAIIGVIVSAAVSFSIVIFKKDLPYFVFSLIACCVTLAAFDKQSGVVFSIIFGALPVFNVLFVAPSWLISILLIERLVKDSNKPSSSDRLAGVGCHIAVNLILTISLLLTNIALYIIYLSGLVIEAFGSTFLTILLINPFLVAGHCLAPFWWRH